MIKYGNYKELERIKAEDEDDRDLTYGHAVNEHTQALQRVVEKMRTTIN